jgi:hypothetical protein
MRPLALLVWSLLLIDRDELKWISIMYQERNYMRAALSVLLAVVLLGIELFAIGYVSANPFGGPVRVHSGPGPKWSVVGELHAGDEVSVSGCVRGWGQHDWCKVSSAGIEGFVHEGALAPSGDRIFVAPVVTVAPAKMRKRPGSGSAVVATIPASAKCMLHTVLMAGSAAGAKLTWTEGPVSSDPNPSGGASPPNELALSGPAKYSW